MAMKCCSQTSSSSLQNFCWGSSSRSENFFSSKLFEVQKEGKFCCFREGLVPLRVQLDKVHARKACSELIHFRLQQFFRQNQFHEKCQSQQVCGNRHLKSRFGNVWHSVIFTGCVSCNYVSLCMICCLKSDFTFPCLGLFECPPTPLASVFNCSLFRPSCRSHCSLTSLISEPVSRSTRYFLIWLLWPNEHLSLTYNAGRKV